MHFALPTRTSRALTSAVPRAYLSRRRRPLLFLLLTTILLLLTYLHAYPIRTTKTTPPHSDQSATTVLILLLDLSKTTPTRLSRIIQNRQSYASAHGYTLFIRNTSDYPTGGAPAAWSRIPVLRHAMARYPAATTFWILDQNAIIMNPNLSLESHVLAPRRLDSIMLRDVPVVPPDSVIKTYRHVPAERVQFVITQSADGLSPASMIVKRGAWAEYLLDAWFDPIFRHYGFQKAEQHALEHIVQWHPTILTKMAVVQRNVLNSASAGYKSGDFVVHLSACDGVDAVAAGCEAEFEAFWELRSVLP